VASLDDLFDALSALRDAGDPFDRRHDAAWRVIDAHLRASFPGDGADADEARQETLIAIGRGVTSMSATVPLQAAKWIVTIHRRKIVDHVRARKRDPAHRGLDRDAESPLVDRLEADDRRPLGPAAIARVIATVEEEVDGYLAETEPSPAERQLRRIQARAALHRHVLEADLEDLLRVLEADAPGRDAGPLGRDRIYKWVERGRPIVVAALDRWASRCGEGSIEAGIAVAVREIVEARRVDAGKPRPDRRKGTPP